VQRRSCTQNPTRRTARATVRPGLVAVKSEDFNSEWDAVFLGKLTIRLVPVEVFAHSGVGSLRKPFAFNNRQSLAATAGLCVLHLQNGSGSLMPPSPSSTHSDGRWQALERTAVNVALNVEADPEKRPANFRKLVHVWSRYAHFPRTIELP
jgi:hypothetical protein